MTICYISYGLLAVLSIVVAMIIQTVISIWKTEERLKGVYRKQLRYERGLGSSFDYAQDDNNSGQDDRMTERNGHVRSLRNDKSSEQARLFNSKARLFKKGEKEWKE